MKEYIGTAKDGSTICYVDRKRWLWLLSVSFPLQPLLIVLLIVTTGNQNWVLLPLLLNYIVAPVLDWVIGEDSNNPPEGVIMQLDQDPYYRWLTYIVVPLHFLTLIGTAWFASSGQLSWWAFVLLALYVGMISGLAINTGHELGHKTSKLEKLLARVVLAIPAYGHFTIEHNRGHHLHVSTPQDPASARMGESIYQFARREIPGALHGAWNIERDRLAKRGLTVWHPDNQILRSYAITALLTFSLVIAFGWPAVPFLLVHNLSAYWQLTSANYIEHYGLLRRRDENGKLERCQPHHSWNCNFVFSNLALFHLERHSDHHSHPQRRYQSLRHFPDLPQLPNGYFGMYVLAYIPLLWFKVMDERLMSLPHVDGDLEKVNIEPSAQASIFLKWGRDKMVEPTCTDIPGT